MLLRSVFIWTGVHIFMSGVAASVLLAWQAEFTIILLTGGLAYFDTVRCHELIFLGNCGVPRSSIVLFTFGTVLVLELGLYASYALWVTS